MKTKTTIFALRAGLETMVVVETKTMVLRPVLRAKITVLVFF